MATKIWILFGSTGEYSDRSEWTVCAYTNEADAKADCAALCARGAGIESLEWKERGAAIAERLQPHDAQAEVDYTGVSYYVGECEVFSARRVPDPAASLVSHEETKT